MFAFGKKASKIAPQKESVYSTSSSASRLPEVDARPDVPAVNDGVLDRKLTDGIDLKFRIAKARVMKESEYAYNQTLLWP
jgi:hypothetical protein